MTGIETVDRDGTTLAYVIRSGATATETAFFTPDDSNFQAGFVVYPAGGRVQAHAHLPVRRQVIGTSELLVVRSGRCFVDIYSDARELISSHELVAGDMVLSVGGGHGFRMLEDTVLFEIKQGPFGGEVEKERFATGPNGEPL